MGSRTEAATFIGFDDKSPATSKKTLVITGDSWVAAEIPSSQISTAARGIIRNLNMRLGNRFEIVNIAGGSGERLDEIQSRFTADVIAYQPAFCAIIGGENDLAQDRTAAQMFAATKLMIDAAVENGIIPLVFPAQGNSGSFGTDSAAAIQLRIDQWGLYNRELLTYSMQKKGWIYLSKAFEGITDQAYIDGTFSVYQPAILAGYQEDVGHVNQAGAFRIAKDIAPQIENLLPVFDVMPRHYSDYGSGCHNPMMLATGTPSGAGVGGGTGITGTPPEGWFARVQGAGTGACTVSQVARTDIAGAFWNRNVCTAMQTGQSIECRESDTTAFNYDYHLLSDYGLAVGDIVEIYAEVKLHAISGTVVTTGTINDVRMTVQFVTAANAGVEAPVANISPGGTSDPYIGTDFADEALVFSTTRYTVPATAAKWFLYLSAGVQSGSTGDCDFTFDIGRVGIRKIQ